MIIIAKYDIGPEFPTVADTVTAVQDAYPEAFLIETLLNDGKRVEYRVAILDQEDETL